jgi:hypothetical protein
MRRVAMILLLSIFCMSSMAYADNGDLTVGGNLIANMGLNMGLRDSSRGLKISCAGAASLTVNAAEAILQDAGGLARRFAVTNKIAAPTSVGAGGLDAGTEQNSTWYYIWLVGSSAGSVDALLSTSSTSPAIPTGYTYSALVGAVYNNSAGSFIPFEQVGNQVILNFLPRKINSGALTASAWTTISSATLAPFFPVTAKKWHILAGGNGNCMIFAPLSTIGGGHYFRPGVSGTYEAGAGAPGSLGLTSRVYWTDFLLPNINGNLYYFVNNAGTDIYAVGWEY